MLGPLDMFSIGIGPSSSHTVGPMKAGLEFASLLERYISQVHRIEIQLFGSLALTGEGHGTFLAVLNGVSGQHPKTIDPDSLHPRVDKIKSTGKILILDKYSLQFDYEKDLIINKKEFLPQHANGMRFIAYDSDKHIVLHKEYFSIGGGFILDEIQIKNRKKLESANTIDRPLPYPFTTADELFNLCKQHNMTVAQLVTANEMTRKTPEQLKSEALELIAVMHYSVERGLHQSGILPGGLNVRRRAPNLYQKLSTNLVVLPQDQRLLAMVYAIAVNEENAAFSRVVTAPTNGSAGTIPGVLEYYRNFVEESTEEKQIEFILTAGCIGMLYKYGASISAAEVGCQGEIGVACSMAAGALTAALGGTLIQVEKAAEIGMEHCLGMTCDPINGLVQIPCIERNGVAASKAIDIARLALLEDLPGKISLDRVIATMLKTGHDMSTNYKETALGGLAVNFVNC